MKRPTIGSFSRSLRASLGLICLLTLPAVARAQTDDFNTGRDTGWARYSPLSALGAGAVYSFPAGHYRIAAPASPLPDLAGPQRAGSLRSINYTRVQVAADIEGWNNAFNQALGVIARVSEVGAGTLDGYTYNYNTSSGFHQINLVIDEQPVTAVNESPFRLNPSQRYRMIFTLADEKLLGQMFSATNPVVPLHSVFAINEAHPSGLAGVFAFALNGTQPIDAQFDNYSATVPGKVRATMLDAAPAVGEQPADPSATVVVRLANLETSINPASIHLEVDGREAVFELLDAAPVFILTHTPANPLLPTAAHTARVSFTDEDGPASFAWSFGAPAVAVPATVLGAATLGETFQTEATAVLDATARKFTVPLTEGAHFFRVRDAVARRITQVEATGGKLVITFE